MAATSSGGEDVRKAYLMNFVQLYLNSKNPPKDTGKMTYDKAV